MATDTPHDPRARAGGRTRRPRFPHDLYAGVRDAFRVLTAIQFAAPWRAPATVRARPLPSRRPTR